VSRGSRAADAPAQRRGRSRPARAPEPAPVTASADPIEAFTGPRIVVRGARTHNLANVDVDLPRDKLVVVTGPSGSGKSSLAFDTVFAEGQRRYVESLSVAARAYLAQLPKPDADLIEGLSPAVAISQSSAARHPRSTVGTVTEIHDYLRLLYARVGEVVSWRSGKPMQRHSIQDMVEAVLALPDDTRLSILAPVVVGRVGDHADLVDDLRRRGFVRVAIDDVVRDLSEPITLDADERHTIEVYVDRLKLKDGIRGRLADSLEIAAGLTGGVVKVLTLEGQVLQFSERYTDFEHELAYPDITPTLFSFNSPAGACPECDGLGVVEVFDPRRIVPDPSLSLAAGAIRALAGRGGAKLRKQLPALAKHLGIGMDTAWRDLPGEAKIAVLEGTGEPVAELGGAFEGVRPLLRRRLAELEARAAQDEESDDDEAPPSEVRAFLGEERCRACEGTRLRLEARMVRVQGKPIHELAAMPLAELRAWIDALELPGESGEVAQVVLDQVRKRLGFLVDVGLHYLTLDRTAVSLSGGESQRIRLATQVGAALVGITYILDEPSIGLHQRDNDRLIAALHRLRDLGNTVIVVEHDEATMRAADWVVDMGPGAGAAGGRVVCAGTPAHVQAHPASVTGAWLSGRASVPVPSQRRRAQAGAVVVKKASGNNLSGVTARFPLGMLTCVTGVSGSGKSTLVIDTLLPEAARVLNGAASVPLPHAGIDGLDLLDKVIHVDQSPIGRSARSNPATYTGIFAELRQTYAQLPEAKIRGYTPARFSFNVKGGRCEACQGEGVRRIEMHFLPDLFVTCQTCNGRRYNRETLAITMRGKSIADVLAMSVAEACDFFVAHPQTRNKLEVLRDVGLGYVALGQSALTLSGGEAQRIKLARELARKATGRTLFILDEPTTGLHFGDVKQLIGVLQRLCDEGNTVVVIEHDLDVIKSADHVIDLGPDGGAGGGKIVATGTPEAVAKSDGGHTSRYLRRVL
jgi:excinuclease ABC subunit A